MSLEVNIKLEDGLFVGEGKTLRFKMVDKDLNPVNVSDWDATWYICDKEVGHAQLETVTATLDTENPSHLLIVLPDSLAIDGPGEYFQIIRKDDDKVVLVYGEIWFNEGEGDALP